MFKVLSVCSRVKTVYTVYAASCVVVGMCHSLSLPIVHQDIVKFNDTVTLG